MYHAVKLKELADRGKRRVFKEARLFHPEEKCTYILTASLYSVKTEVKMSTNEQVRVEFLKKLDTKGLVDRLFTLENELEQAMLTESEYKYVHAHDFAGYNSDSRAVEEIMAALMPPADKKTVDQRKAWLTL
jgi:hypothetical protein